MTHIEHIKPQYLNMLFLRYSRQELIKLLGIKESEYYALKKQHNYKTGLEFLREIDPVTLVDMWTTFKSRGEMARFFRVSTSFLDSVFKRVLAGRKEYLRIQPTNKGQLEVYLHMYGSKGIVARLMDVNSGEMNKICRKYGITHSDLSHVTSGYESSKGLTAEKAFESIRGASILKDMNEIDPRAPYDYVDEEYGNVNVKASRAFYSRRRRARYGKFNLNGGCDSYALMFYDDNFKKLLYWVVVPAKGLKAKTYSVYHDNPTIEGMELKLACGPDSINKAIPTAGSNT